MRIRTIAGAVALSAALLFGSPAAARAADTPLPVSGDTAALMEQINGQLATARELADVNEPLTGSVDAPFISPSVQDTLDMLRGLQDGDPGALGRMSGLIEGEIYRNQVGTDVYRYHQGTGEPNGHVEY